MKICFVQPESEYQIKNKRHALAQTFPQIIASLYLEEEEYCIYIFGRNDEPFISYILNNNVTHVFITSLTSTFPHAVKIAQIAKESGVIVCIGGLFATMNAQIINVEYVIIGHSNRKMLDDIKKGKKGIIDTGLNRPEKLFPISDIVTNRYFAVYKENDPVCYELVNGCPFSCLFCTIKTAFNSPCLVYREENVIERELDALAQKWNHLKLIDDDISIAFQKYNQLSFRNYTTVIAESRVDNVNDIFLRKLQKAGVTHLLMGIEDLDNGFINNANKSSADNWKYKCLKAIDLCQKYNIVSRPVIMITTPETTLKSIDSLRIVLKDWKPQNGIEVLFSFYTPHPGLRIKISRDELVSNNLKDYDHLHLVYRPKHIHPTELFRLIELYEELVFITQSREYNPPIECVYESIAEYMPFFNKMLE